MRPIPSKKIGKIDLIHHHLLEVASKTETAPESSTHHLWVVVVVVVHKFRSSEKRVEVSGRVSLSVPPAKASRTR